MAHRISDQDREALRASMPLLLGELCGVENLRRPFRCPSPAHDDREPSARYYEDNCTVHCFGCGGTWDAFSLVGMLRGIEGFPAQARAVAEIAGYSLDEARRPGAMRGRPAREREARRQAFPEPRPAGVGYNVAPLCDDAYLRLYTAEGDAARRYLHSRGLGDDDILRHGLGFVAEPKRLMPEFSVWEPRALGFVVVPFWDEAMADARYCMLRTVPGDGGTNNKEWRPKGAASPLWREWLLTAGEPVVYVAEGLLDAMALGKMLGKPTVALGGCSNASRLSSVLTHTPESRRPGKIVIAMDEDGEGRKAAARIARDLDAIVVPHAAMPPYPDGAKDADEWLVDARGGEWDFEELTTEALPAPLRKTRWAAGHER